MEIELDIDAPPTPPETANPVSSNEEGPGSSLENDTDLLIQDSADLIDTDAPETADPESEAVPNKVNDKAERVTQLPLSKVRQIMKLDPEVTLVSQEATFLITKATELFINLTAKEAYAFTLSKRKKTVNIQDLNSAIGTDSPLFFLQGCLDS